MDAPTSCGLCEGSFEGQGHDRVGGLALCRHCFVGNVQQVVEKRGWVLWSKHAEYAPNEADVSEMRYRTEVRITLAGDTGLDLVCQRRTLWRGLRGLLRGQARSKDPLFAAHVCVWTPRPAQVEALLARDGVEGCLMEVLGNYPTSAVKVWAGTVRVYYVADDPHTEGELVARACVLAHHVDGLSTQSRSVSEAASPGLYAAPPRRGS